MEDDWTYSSTPFQYFCPHTNTFFVFSFDLNPTKRDSFWIVVIGTTFQLLGQISSQPTSVQKFLALPTFKDAAW
jgi:hypothetical protein